MKFNRNTAFGESMVNILSLFSREGDNGAAVKSALMSVLKNAAYRLGGVNNIEWVPFIDLSKKATMETSDVENFMFDFDTEDSKAVLPLAIPLRVEAPTPFHEVRLILELDAYPSDLFYYGLEFKTEKGSPWYPMAFPESGMRDFLFNLCFGMGKENSNIILGQKVETDPSWSSAIKSAKGYELALDGKHLSANTEVEILYGFVPFNHRRSLPDNKHQKFEEKDVFIFYRRTPGLGVESAKIKGGVSKPIPGDLVWAFRQSCLKPLIVNLLVIESETYDNLTKLISAPPEPSPALKKLMSMKTKAIRE